MFLARVLRGAGEVALVLRVLRVLLQEVRDLLGSWVLGDLLGQVAEEPAGTHVVELNCLVLGIADTLDLVQRVAGSGPSDSLVEL